MFSYEKYIQNLDYYYNAVTAVGAVLVLCSPIERLTLGQTELPWSSDDVDTVYATAAKMYAESKNIPYIDLNKLTTDLNNELGLVKAWYLHTVYWQESTSKPVAYNDATHMNDYGADNTCYLLMSRLKEISSEYVQDNLKSAVMPSEEFMKNNAIDYVMPPYMGNSEMFPYPSESDFEYEVELSEGVCSSGLMLKGI